jgi:hypothetical protein
LLFLQKANVRAWCIACICTYCFVCWLIHVWMWVCMQISNQVWIGVSRALPFVLDWILAEFSHLCSVWLNFRKNMHALMYARIWQLHTWARQKKELKGNFLITCMPSELYRLLTTYVYMYTRTNNLMFAVGSQIHNRQPAMVAQLPLLP